jgi:hypothetical protein
MAKGGEVNGNKNPSLNVNWNPDSTAQSSAARRWAESRFFSSQKFNARQVSILAFEAGLEEAAQKMDDLAAKCTALNDLHGHACEIDCESVKYLAAEIRAMCKSEQK